MKLLAEEKMAELDVTPVSELTGFVDPTPARADCNPRVRLL